MSVTKVGVFGSGGRMGQEVLALLESQKRFRPWGLSAKDKPDVVIDFSSPAGLMKLLTFCVKNQVPLVSGTTGLAPAQMTNLKRASTKIPIFFAPNMSIGLNIMAQCLSEFSERFENSEVEIVEIHHRNKKDNPSGTANFLYDTVRKSKHESVKIKRPVGLRGGSVFGIHSTYFFGDGEFVKFEHQATDRTVFARGAVKAAEWIKSKGPGLYGMKDLLQGD